MAIKDIVKLNGETQNLPARRDDMELSSPYRDLTRGLSDWDPWFNSMFNRMLNLSPFSDWLSRPNWGSLANLDGAGALGSYVPAVNVTETENEYKVTAELPGIEPGDIDLNFSGGALTIKGEKKQEHEEKEQGYYRMERSYGQFRRSVQLPEGVDGDKIDASFKNGVLTVTVPKLPELKRGARKLTIESAEK